MKKIKCVDDLFLESDGDFICTVHYKYKQIASSFINKDVNSKNIYLNIDKTFIYLVFWSDGVTIYQLLYSKIYINKNILKHILAEKNIKKQEEAI